MAYKASVSLDMQEQVGGWWTDEETVFHETCARSSVTNGLQ